MPLSVEEVAPHGNFSSNNRIKRSLVPPNSDDALKNIIEQFFNSKKGKFYFSFLNLVIICSYFWLLLLIVRYYRCVIS